MVRLTGECFFHTFLLLQGLIVWEILLLLPLIVTLAMLLFLIAIGELSPAFIPPLGADSVPSNPKSQPALQSKSLQIRITIFEPGYTKRLSSLVSYLEYDGCGMPSCCANARCERCRTSRNAFKRSAMMCIFTIVKKLSLFACVLDNIYAIICAVHGKQVNIS